ncbi:MAG TPA: hypothetical protein VK892_13135, partial [Pyrinomonadaceae bacterium]|nr:hypothetical protein [Pyrinomonadaceae bacterium]
MRKNISRNKFGQLNVAVMFIGILLGFSIFAVQEVPAQLDKLKKAVKKVENEINKEAAKPKTETGNNPTISGTENNS